MQIKSLKPVLPNDKRDPVGAMRQVIRSYKELDSRLNRIYSALARRIGEIPRERVALNEINRQSFEYRYLIDPVESQNIALFIQELIYSEILGSENGAFSDLWFMNPFVEEQYEKATEEALQSTKNLASAEAVGSALSNQIRSIQAEYVLMSAGYQTRIALVKNRLFEEMKGLSDQMKQDLGGVLGRGIAAGHGINRIKSDIRKKLWGDDPKPKEPKGFKYRAERIARTEINNAYRTAYWAETDELNNTVWKDSGFVTRLLWYSALAPTTRRTHAKRHGEIFTTTQVREFYSVDGNPINCMCVQVEILIKKSTGEVINKNIVNKLKKQKENYLKVH